MVWMMHDWWSPTITCSRCLSFWKLSAVYSLNILPLYTHGNCLFIYIFVFSLKWNHDANQHRKWAMQERNKAHCIPQLLRASVRCCPCFLFFFSFLSDWKNGKGDGRRTIRNVEGHNHVRFFTAKEGADVVTWIQQLIATGWNFPTRLYRGSASHRER